MKTDMGRELLQQNIQPELDVGRIPKGECWQYIYSTKYGLVVAIDNLENHSTICGRIKWTEVVVGGHIVKISDNELVVDRFNTASITEGRSSYVSQTKYPTEEVFSSVIGRYNIVELERVDCKSENKKYHLFYEHELLNRDGD